MHAIFQGLKGKEKIEGYKLYKIQTNEALWIISQINKLPSKKEEKEEKFKNILKLKSTFWQKYFVSRNVIISEIKSKEKVKHW